MMMERKVAGMKRVEEQEGSSDFDKWSLLNAESLAEGFIFGLEKDEQTAFKAGILKPDFNAYCQEEYEKFCNGKYQDEYIAVKD